MLKSRRSTVAGRGVALTTAAAFVLAVAAPQAVQAQPLAKARVAQTETVKAGAGDATDFSAKRYRRGNRVYRNNNAAGLAFMGLALGTIGAVVANQQRRDYYRQNYYYGGNPYYGGHYYGSPGYYGNGYYGNSYYNPY